MYMYFLLGDPEVTANIYCKSRNLPKWTRKITVQICGNFWVTQYLILEWRTFVKVSDPAAVKLSGAPLFMGVLNYIVTKTRLFDNRF